MIRPILRGILATFIAACIGCTEPVKIPYTASGFWRPTLPDELRYASAMPQKPISEGVRIHPVGVRIDSDNSLLVDLLIAGRDPEAARQAALATEMMGMVGNNDFISIVVDPGSTKTVLGWRTAMHERNPDMHHFSVLSHEAKVQLPDLDGYSRWIVTHEFVPDESIEDDTVVRCVLNRDAVSEYSSLFISSLPLHIDDREYAFNASVVPSAP